MWTKKGNRDIETTESTSRMIYRCTNKACRATLAIDWHVTTVTEYVAGRQILKPQVRVPILPPLHLPFPEYSYIPWAVGCPMCQIGEMHGKTIRGIVTNHQCDSACTGAKGHNCECSCGGKNHGRDYLPT